MNIIRAIGVEKYVDNPEHRIHILKGVDLLIKRGESVAITGISGSGKTTLLSLLAGLDVPTQGDIYIEDIHLNSLTEDQRAAIRLSKIGFIFQNFDLLPHFDALENVMLPMELLGISHCSKKASVFLEQVGLGDRQRHFPAQLSGGEQQRVAIARAFSTQPAILLADEPTGNLDRETAEKVAKILFSLNDEMKTTLVIVTHDLALSARCDRILRLVEGKLGTLT